MQQRQAKGRRLAGAGLSNTHQIMAINNGLDGLFLNRGGGVISFVRYGAKEWLSQFKARKISHIVSFHLSHDYPENHCPSLYEKD